MSYKLARYCIGAAGVISLVAVSACGSSSASTPVASTAPRANIASAPGVTPTTISLGYITSLTGVASSSFANAVNGAQARIDLQNAEGGVDGRKLQLVVADDESAPASDATAAESLIETRHVFAVIDVSSFTFGGAKYLQQNGIPVTGQEFDGPEWGEEPYSNMFSYLPPVDTPYDGGTYTYSYWGKFAHKLGITKVAGFAYGTSPSSVASMKGILASAATGGASTCYSDLSVPFGGVDFTAAVLAMKSSGCNGAVTTLVDTSDIALDQEVKNSAVDAKVILGGTGYDQNILDSPSAEQSLNGAYMSSTVLFDPSIPAVGKMLNALVKYAPGYKSGAIPEFGEWASYLAADLMVKGLEVAGRNPTRSTFISNLRKVTSYNAEGVLPTSVDFANFGTLAQMPKTACQYYVQLKNGSYINAMPGVQPVCGTRLKHS